MLLVYDIFIKAFVEIHINMRTVSHILITADWRQNITLSWSQPKDKNTRQSIGLALEESAFRGILIHEASCEAPLAIAHAHSRNPRAQHAVQDAVVQCLVEKSLCRPALPLEFSRKKHAYLHSQQFGTIKRLSYAPQPPWPSEAGAASNYRCTAVPGAMPPFTDST